MAILNHHDMDELKNRNEEKVWQSIEDSLNADPKLCRCRDCVLDTAALALNSLPARYAVYSFHGNEKEEESAVDEVRAAVSAAIEKVRTRPHHF